MSILTILIPVTLAMGLVGLAVFFWSLRDGQYEDLSGDAARILHDEDVPLQPAKTKRVAQNPAPDPAPDPATTKETIL